MKDITLKLLLNDQLTAKLKSTVDSASKSLAGLQNKLNGLKAPETKSGGVSGGVGFSDLVGANVLGSAISSVASGVLAAGESLVASIGNAFNQAAESNRGALGSSGAIASLLGTSFEEAQKIQTQVTGELTKSARTLPGATKDYLDAFNGISDSLSLSGGLTKKGLNDGGQDIVELTALLGQQSGAGSGATSTALGKMLGETGSEALFRIDVFEKVPAFKVNLEKGLSKAGKTLDDFFNMDARQKQEYLVKAKNSLYSEDFLRAMNQAADGQIDTLKSDLFDPVSGVFGFSRILEGLGNTSVFNEVGNLISVLKPMFESINRVLEQLGISFADPMVVLANILINTGNFIKSITSTLNSLNLSGLSFGDIVGKVSSGLSGMIGSAMSGVLSVLKGTNWGEAGYTVTNGLLKGVIWMMDVTTQYIQANSGTIMGMAYEGLRAVVHGLYGMMMAVRDNLPNLFTSVVTLALTSLAQGLGVAITGMAGVLVGAVQGIRDNLVSGFKLVADAVTGAFNSVVSQAQSLLSNLTGGSNSSSNQPNQSGNVSVGNAWNGQNLGSAISREVLNMPQGSKPVIANSSEIIIPRSKAGILNNQINITVNAQLDRVVREVTDALTISLAPLSMV